MRVQNIGIAQIIESFGEVPNCGSIDVPRQLGQLLVLRGDFIAHGEPPAVTATDEATDATDEADAPADEADAPADEADAPADEADDTPPSADALDDYPDYVTPTV